MTTLDDNEWWWKCLCVNYESTAKLFISIGSHVLRYALKNKEAKIHTSCKFSFNWLAVRCKLLAASRHVANLQMCVFTRILTGPGELSTNYKARRGQILAPSPSIISSRVIRKHKLLTRRNQAEFNRETLLPHTFCLYNTAMLKPKTSFCNRELFYIFVGAASTFSIKVEHNTACLFSQVGVLLGHVGLDLLDAPRGDHVGVELGVGLHNVLGDPVQGPARHPA